MDKWLKMGSLFLGLFLLCSCNMPAQQVITSPMATTAQPTATTTATATATESPTEEPTAVVTATPNPTLAPTPTPTQAPTMKPTTQAPTKKPTPTPTKKPTLTPTKTPKPTMQWTEGSLKGLVIGIDPGHQGKGNSEQEPIGPGATTTRKKVSSGTQGKWSRVPEYKVVLEVGLQLKALLEEAGATVLMSRETHNVNISNAERAKMMNEAGADLVIRIHCNGNDNTSVYGACMLVPSGTYNPEIHATSKAAGEVILNEFVKVTGAKNNGVIKRNDLSGFNWSTVPVCLIEMGYMSNKQEDSLLTSAEYQKKCAQGLFQGVLSYFQ